MHCLDNSFAVGTPLKDWDISIYYGIKTGFNDAFIVDQTTRDALVAADPRSAELLKPILRGRDIARYRANWAGLWLIDTHNGYADVPPINADEYPAVKAHLDRFIEHLEHRQDQGITPYNLRNCAYHEEFASEKVIWIELVDRGRFAYDDSRMFIEATAFMITGKQMSYLCAILNSRLAHWYILKTAPTSGMGVSRWKKVYMESVPVAKPCPSTAIRLRKLVEEARSATSSVDSHSYKIEKQIDELVYEIYGISAEEIQVIESATSH